MYVAQFVGDAEERRTLLDYLIYLEDIDGARGNREFGESSFWTELTSETAVGFSRDRVILQSGHALHFARLTAPNTPSGIGAALRNLLAAVRGPREGPLAGFRRHYPSLGLDEEALVLNPGAYLRGVEALAQAQKIYDVGSVKQYLEIGAGAGMSIHALMERSPRAKIVVIDLPESIPVAYLTLKSLRPELRIALPHKLIAPLDSGYDVVFLHPDQIDRVPATTFDMVFNMSSFQEMELDVVNHYISHAADWLGPAGVLVSGKSSGIALHPG